MATNGKPKKESTAVATTTKKAPSTKAGTQDVAAVAQHGATLLQNIYRDIAFDERERDAFIDAKEDRVLDMLLKELEDDSVPFEQRQEVRKQYFERIDKRRSISADARKENTKRLMFTLCCILVGVLGVAGLKYAFDIIKDCTIKS